jgi:hypothetical protein
MAITKANILTFVNTALQENFSGTQLDTEIQQVLDDLSDEDLLVGSDDTQTLSSGDLTLNTPTGFRALIAITLTITSSGSEQYPLQKLKGGHQEYRKLRHNDSSSGIPRWFSEFNDLFYLWRPPNQNFSTLIEYYKDHPQDVNTIEFDEGKYKNVIYNGVTYFVAMNRGKITYLNIWKPAYYEEKAKIILEHPPLPRFCEG